MTKLLMAAAAIDNRRLDGVQGEAALAAWMQTIGDLGYQECVQALAEHRRSAPGVWLEPGHIFALVTESRAQGPSELDRERAAFDEFVEYTGIEPRRAAERWNDEPWKREQIDVARKAHRQRAIEAGAA